MNRNRWRWVLLVCPWSNYCMPRVSVLFFKYFPDLICHLFSCLNRLIQAKSNQRPLWWPLACQTQPISWFSNCLIKNSFWSQNTKIRQLSPLDQHSLVLVFQLISRWFQMISHYVQLTRYFSATATLILFDVLLHFSNHFRCCYTFCFHSLSTYFLKCNRQKCFYMLVNNKIICQLNALSDPFFFFWQINPLEIGYSFLIQPGH